MQIGAHAIAPTLRAWCTYIQVVLRSRELHVAHVVALALNVPSSHAVHSVLLVFVHAASWRSAPVHTSHVPHVAPPADAWNVCSRHDTHAGWPSAGLYLQHRAVSE